MYTHIGGIPGAASPSHSFYAFQVYAIVTLIQHCYNYLPMTTLISLSLLSPVAPSRTPLSYLSVYICIYMCVSIHSEFTLQYVAPTSTRLDQSKYMYIPVSIFAFYLGVPCTYISGPLEAPQRADAGVSAGSAENLLALFFSYALVGSFEFSRLHNEQTAVVYSVKQLHVKQKAMSRSAQSCLVRA